MFWFWSKHIYLLNLIYLPWLHSHGFTFCTIPYMYLLTLIISKWLCFQLFQPGHSKPCNHNCWLISKRVEENWHKWYDTYFFYLLIRGAYLLCNLFHKDKLAIFLTIELPCHFCQLHICCCGLFPSSYICLSLYVQEKKSHGFSTVNENLYLVTTIFKTSFIIGNSQMLHVTKIQNMMVQKIDI